MATRTPRQRVRILKAKNADLSRKVKDYATQSKAAKTAIYDPTATLSGPALQSAAKQVTDASINPKIAALDQQASSATTQGLALADRAKSYGVGVRKESDAATAHQQALGQMLSTAQTATGQRAQAAFDAAGAQESARAAADTSLRGGGLGGGGSDAVAGEITAGRGIAANTQASAESAGNAQSANYAGLTGLLGEARSMRSDETYDQLLNRLANKQAEIGQTKATTEASRGDELTKNLLSLRQTGFENYATNLGLGLDQLKAQNDAANDAAVAKEAAAKRRSAARQAKRADATRRDIATAGNETSAANNANTNATSRQNTQDRINAQDKKPKKESAQAVSVKRAVGNVSAEAKALVDEARQAGYNSPAAVRGWVSARLQKKATNLNQVLPNDVLSAALDLGLDGHVSQRNIKRLKQAGVQIPNDWLLRTVTPSQGATTHPRT
jgi:hypothetical protein